jgi:ribose transport system ATP-binding protein
MESETRNLLTYLGVEQSISPQALVGRLSVAQQQTVEIAKALSFDARVVVMDEPTASLASTEVDALFERVQALQQTGIAFVYISHRLDEIRKIAQRITVLKDGELVGTGQVDEFPTSQLVSMMVGRELSDYYPDYGSSEVLGEPVLTIEQGSNEHVHDINLSVRKGEIVGIAGLEGSGRSELARAIFGVEPFSSGRMTLSGSAVHFRHPREAIQSGVGFLTEDRKTEGLVLTHAVSDNALLAKRSVKEGARIGNERDLVVNEARRVDLRAAGLHQEARVLSGGNQQKVVLMKWLATNASFFIFDEPTRGIDVGAKAGIHELMRELANAGAAILMISSELPEVIGMSDRIVIMSQGTIAGELPSGTSEANIMAVAAQSGKAVA